jgi:indole-3-glycerol phosphate synthase
MTPSVASADLLSTIVAATKRIVAVRMEREPLAALGRRAESSAVRPGAFRAALARTDRLNIIAECKRRSPSRGVLRARYDPVAVARSYESGGAAAISVLTEPTFFDGAIEHLAAVRAAVRVPLLRKDFIVSEYQLLEARASGADAILLIVGALTSDELARLFAAAHCLRLETLVEVHDADELSRAIDAGAQLIGVNNRNLRTLTVDVDASERLMAHMPAHVVAVSESGLKSAADLRRLRSLGYRAFLIGERFMTSPEPGAALAELLEQSA